MPQIVTIRSLPEAFNVFKEMQADGCEWGEDYRGAGREVLAEIIQGRMHEAIDRQLEARARCDDLSGAMHLAGHEHEQRVYSAIAAMDILLLTSRAEGLPNVLVEAQALGLPVVTTRAGGAPEAVRHGVSGWVLESDGVAHAATLLVRLLRDAGWRATARQAGPALVQDTFSVGRMLDETLAAYGSDWVGDGFHRRTG